MRLIKNRFDENGNRVEDPNPLLLILLTIGLLSFVLLFGLEPKEDIIKGILVVLGSTFSTISVIHLILLNFFENFYHNLFERPNRHVN